jgi:hypothetical protein
MPNLPKNGRFRGSNYGFRGRLAGNQTDLHPMKVRHCRSVAVLSLEVDLWNSTVPHLGIVPEDKGAGHRLCEVTLKQDEDQSG